MKNKLNKNKLKKFIKKKYFFLKSARLSQIKNKQFLYIILTTIKIKKFNKKTLATTFNSIGDFLYFIINRMITFYQKSNFIYCINYCRMISVPAIFTNFWKR